MRNPQPMNRIECVCVSEWVKMTWKCTQETNIQTKPKHQPAPAHTKQKQNLWIWWAMVGGEEWNLIKFMSRIVYPKQPTWKHTAKMAEMNKFWDVLYIISFFLCFRLFCLFVCLLVACYLSKQIVSKLSVFVCVIFIFIIHFMFVMLKIQLKKLDRFICINGFIQRAWKLGLPRNEVCL